MNNHHYCCTRNEYIGMQLKFISILLCILYSTNAWGITASDPSFNCDNAKTPTENLICSDGGLSALDKAIFDVYLKRYNAGPPPASAALVQQQREWLKMRDTACPVPAAPDDGGWPLVVLWEETACLASLFPERLMTLGAPVTIEQPEAAKKSDYIHPFCIAAAAPTMEGKEQPPVPLKECNKGNAHNPPKDEGGALEAESTSRSQIAAWYSTRHLGKLSDGRELVSVTSNTGGSGYLSSILAIHRQSRPDGEVMLSAKPLIYGGDRCNNGIVKASLNGDTLSLSIGTTPLMLMTAAGAAQASVNNSSLLDCANCCVGNLSFDYSITERNKKAVSDLLLDRRIPISAQADQDYSIEETSGEGILPNRCFLEVLHKTASSLPHEYDTVALKALGKAFDTCITNNKR